MMFRCTGDLSFSKNVYDDCDDTDDDIIIIIWDYWVFGLRISSHILKHTTFEKVDLFPSPGERVGDRVGVSHPLT
jgi:hypothetical protein